MSPLASSSAAGGEGQLSCSRLLVPCHLNMKIHSLKTESADLISCPPPVFFFFISTLEPPNLSKFYKQERLRKIVYNFFINITEICFVYLNIILRNTNILYFKRFIYFSTLFYALQQRVFLRFLNGLNRLIVIFYMYEYFLNFYTDIQIMRF